METSAGAVTARPATTLASTVRTVAAVTVAGAALGVLLGGVGGRLGMSLLAQLNPEDAGSRTSDDFVIGRVSADTIFLLGATLQFGLGGAFVFALIRPALSGPGWARTVCCAAGAAVMAGLLLLLLNEDDFANLQPSWVAVGVFLVIPAAYGAGLVMLTDRWLRPRSWFRTAPLGWVAATLLLWLPMPLLLPLIGLWCLRAGIERLPGGTAILGHPATLWAIRVALMAVWLFLLVHLVEEIRQL